MTKKTTPLIVLFVGMLLAVGLFFTYQASKELPLTPDIGIPESNFDTTFKITAPSGWNTFKTGQSIQLEVEVIGDNPIEFVSDFGVVIFELDNGEWVEIPNFMDYPPGTFRLFPSEGNYLNYGSTSIDPLVLDETKATQLRVILVGNIVRNDRVTTELVSATIDLILKP